MEKLSDLAKDFSLEKLERYLLDKPPLTLQNQPIIDQIIQKVDQILTLTKSEDYDTNQEKQEQVKRLEHKIDQLVYQLYNLTEEEIKIIEGGYNG
jgi:hypothetical protein